MNYKKRIFTFLSLIIIASSIVFILIISKNNDSIDIQSMRVAYPVYDNEPPNISMREPFGLDYFTKTSDLIIVGEVSSDMDSYKVDLNQINTPEYQLEKKAISLGKEKDIPEFKQTKIKVLDCWKGDQTVEELVAIQNMIFVPYSPNLNANMKLVLFLTDGGNYHKGKYWISKYGMYYITEEDLVLSTVSLEKFNEYSGQSLKNFKKQVVELLK